MKDAPLLVVVPAFRAAETIGQAVAALLSAGVPASRIAVVDDASGDETAALASRAGARVIEMPINAGAAAARNAGARALPGDPIVFVDADVAVHTDAIARIAARMAADPGLDALFGSYDAAPGAPGRVSRIRNLLHHHVHQEGAGPAATFWTGLGAVRREAFEATGGFDPRQDFMEDIAFGHALWRMGRRIELGPEIQGCHLKRWTLAGMLRADLMHRAIPWSRLMLAQRGEGPPAGLAAGPAARGSVLCVAAGLAGLLAAPWAPAGLLAAAAALAGLAWLNRGFLALLRRVGRRGDVPAALGVLALHYLAAGLGFALCLTGLDRWVAPPARRG